jgi:3-oxoadipate enol-lactonase
MAIAKLKDTQLFYQLDGPEGAPVLVFSNSLGTTHRLWDPQVEAFSKDFRMLRYDSRGHGESSLTPGPYNIEQLAGDVLQLLDTLRLDRVFFCGLSIGGMVGMYLGANASARFHKIVLCNTAAKIGTQDTWNARITAVQQGGMKAIAGGVIDRWLTAGYRASHVRQTESVREMLESIDAAAYASTCAAVRDMDYREKLAMVQAPVLIISGTHDSATTPADGHFLESSIRGAKYAELSAAHLSNIEAREDFDRVVLGFLKSQGAHG